jgi:SHS2 domain-containing protein
MWGYMTDLRSIAVDPARTCVIEARGVDLISLLFAWMDGCLYAYGSEYFVGREVAVTHWSGGGAEGWRMRAVARGERFEFGRHPQGTEVKAITYSNMQIFSADGTLVTANDASDAAARAAAEGAAAGGGGGEPAPAAPQAAAGAQALAGAAGGVRAGARRAEVDVYVIVDI